MKFNEANFNEMMKCHSRYFELKCIFDEWIVRKYGFHYSDRDVDYLVDSIDYGLKPVSFKEFDKIMKKEKELK